MFLRSQERFHYLHLSKKTIHLLRQNKDYTLNNTYVDYQTILKDKDILSIKAYEQGRDFIEEESSLEIIYEDDLLCIVNKPSNLIIHPDDKSKKNTLCNYVSYYYQQTHQDLPIRYLHRLDRDTTGLVMFCKCALLQPYFDVLIASKEIKKTYLAIIQGHLPKREMTIDLPIGQDRHSKNKMCISKTGKDALTHFKEIKTKEMAKALTNLKVEGKALIVLPEKNENVQKSARNIEGVKTSLVNTINVYDLLKYKNLVITLDTVKKLEEVYA